MRAGPRHRRREIAAATGELDQHRVEVGADLGTQMLVKLTCRGRDFSAAVRRARRAVAEFRIRGVSTNIPFLAAVLDDPDFQAGRITTSFIDERPQLMTARSSADRGTKILNYLADVTVDRHGPRPSRCNRRTSSRVDLGNAAAPGAKHRFPKWDRRDSPHGCAESGR